jgi:hypothetical protein
MGLELAAYHPRFIVDQVVATCQFLGRTPELKSPYIDYAINNLGVRRKSKSEGDSDQPPGAAKKPSGLNLPSGVFDES